MKSTVLVLSFSNLDRDPRVSRHIQALASEFQVVTCGLSRPKEAVIGHFPVHGQPRRGIAKLSAGVSLLSGGFERFYWAHPFIKAALPQLERERFDAILANDLLSLPLALRIAKQGAVIFDAHEYSPKEFSHSWRWRMLFSRYNDYQCRTYLHLARARVTVCGGIAHSAISAGTVWACL